MLRPPAGASSPLCPAAPSPELARKAPLSRPPPQAPGAAGLTSPALPWAGRSPPLAAAAPRPRCARAARSGPPVPPGNYFNVRAQRRHRVRASRGDRRRRPGRLSQPFSGISQMGRGEAGAGHQGPFNEFISQIILPAPRARGTGGGGGGRATGFLRPPPSVGLAEPAERGLGAREGTASRVSGRRDPRPRAAAASVPPLPP